MLGRAANSASNVLEQLGKNIDRTKLLADYKYDGERTQIHVFRPQLGVGSHNLSMFSRNFDRQNAKFWHFESLLAQHLSRKTKDFIIDGELVYLD